MIGHVYIYMCMFIYLFSGYNLVDQILGILLKTNMFIGGLFGCFLDNTIPGKNHLYF